MRCPTERTRKARINRYGTAKKMASEMMGIDLRSTPTRVAVLVGMVAGVKGVIEKSVGDFSEYVCDDGEGESEEGEDIDN